MTAKPRKMSEILKEMSDLTGKVEWNGSKPLLLGLIPDGRCGSTDW